MQIISSNFGLVHVLMAVLCVWRVTDLFTQDRITAKLRQKFPTYLWQCPRCMSVWAGLFAAVGFYSWPWANWPFALSWLYIWHNEIITSKRLVTKGRRLLLEVAPDGQGKFTNELSPQEVLNFMSAAGIIKPEKSEKKPNGNAGLQG